MKHYRAQYIEHNGALWSTMERYAALLSTMELNRAPTSAIDPIQDPSRARADNSEIDQLVVDVTNLCARDLHQVEEDLLGETCVSYGFKNNRER